MSVTINEERNDRYVQQMMSYSKGIQMNKVYTPLNKIYIPDRSELTTEFKTIDNLYTYYVPHKNIISIIPNNRKDVVIMSHKNNPSDTEILYKLKNRCD